MQPKFSGGKDCFTVNNSGSYKLDMRLKKLVTHPPTSYCTQKLISDKTTKLLGGKTDKYLYDLE